MEDMRSYIERAEAKAETFQEIIQRQAEGLAKNSLIEDKLEQIVQSIEAIENNEAKSFTLSKIIESQTSELASIKARLDTNTALEDVIKGQVSAIQNMELERLRESSLEEKVENATRIFVEEIDNLNQTLYEKLDNIGMEDLNATRCASGSDDGGSTNISPAHDCGEIMALEGNDYTAGVKTIIIMDKTVQVYCDHDGYTTIQSRGQFGYPMNYFYRNWDEYLGPFGKPGEEFWLGLENIYNMTNQKHYSLKIDAEDQDGNVGQATWSNFRLTENVSM